MTEEDKLGWGIIGANVATAMTNLAFALKLRKERKDDEKDETSKKKKKGN